MTTTHDYGELLYEFTGKLTDVTEYGVSMQDALAGSAPIPLAGLRVDVAFEGDVRGKLTGHAKGIDYLLVRPDGRMELDIRSAITTHDGKRIAFTGGGVGIPEPGSSKGTLREHGKLTTASPEYAWLNPLEVWVVGELDMQSQMLTTRGYVP